MGHLLYSTLEVGASLQLVLQKLVPRPQGAVSTEFFGFFPSPLRPPPITKRKKTMGVKVDIRHGSFWRLPRGKPSRLAASEPGFGRFTSCAPSAHSILPVNHSKQNSIGNASQPPLKTLKFPAPSASASQQQGGKTQWGKTTKNPVD